MTADDYDTFWPAHYYLSHQMQMDRDRDFCCKTPQYAPGPQFLSPLRKHFFETLPPLSPNSLRPWYSSDICIFPQKSILAFLRRLAHRP